MEIASLSNMRDKSRVLVTDNKEEDRTKDWNSDNIFLRVWKFKIQTSVDSHADFWDALEGMEVSRGSGSAGEGRWKVISTNIRIRYTSTSWTVNETEEKTTLSRILRSHVSVARPNAEQILGHSLAGGSHYRILTNRLPQIQRERDSQPETDKRTTIPDIMNSELTG